MLSVRTKSGKMATRFRHRVTMDVTLLSRHLSTSISKFLNAELVQLGKHSKCLLLVGYRRNGRRPNGGGNFSLNAQYSASRCSKK